jgi:multiple sugar transport system substrate-binding protein
VAVANPATPEAFAVFNEQMKSATQRGPHPQWPDISRAVQVALQEALTETSTPEAALKKAAAAINPVLARTPL